MKALKFLTLITLFIFLSEVGAQSKKRDVYRTKKGESYHKKDCKIIKNREVLMISLKEAKKKGFKACRVCHPVKKNNVVKEKKSTSKVKVPPKKSVATRCMGITKKGTRCKRMTKSADGTCWQH